MGVSAKKFALRKKNGLKTALYGLLGEFFRGNACGWALLGEFFHGNAANSLTLGGMCQVLPQCASLSDTWWDG